MSEQKTEMKTNATSEADEKLRAFAHAIVEKATNRIVRAKETAYKPLAFEFSPLDLGMNNAEVEQVRVYYTREKINKVISKLLGCSVTQYESVVLPEIEKAEAWQDYNQTIRAMLKENKHLLLNRKE